MAKDLWPYNWYGIGHTYELPWSWIQKAERARKQAEENAAKRWYTTVFFQRRVLDHYEHRHQSDFRNSMTVEASSHEEAAEIAIRKTIEALGPPRGREGSGIYRVDVGGWGVVRPERIFRVDRSGRIAPW